MPEIGPGRRRALTLVRRGAEAVIGGALAVAMAGALYGSPTLVGLGLVVAAEESLEFAVVLGALRIERLPTRRPSLSVIPSPDA